MSKPLKSTSSHPVFRITFYSAIIVIFIVITSITILPSLVSTKWFKDVAQETINKQINRSITIGNLKWSWIDGIMITDVALKDDPLFSSHPMFILKKAVLKIQLGEIWSGRIGTDIYLDSIDIRLIRDSKGRTNLEALFPTSTDDIQKQETEQETDPGIDFSDISFSLPIDVKTSLKVTNVSFSLNDQKENRKIALKNGVVALSMPSMFFKPVNMVVSGEAMIDDREPSQIEVNLLIINQQTLEKRYIISHTLIKLDGNLPGTKISLNGNLSDQGVKGEIVFDLSPIAHMAMPFLPENLLNSKFNGNIELILDAGMSSGHVITFDSRMIAKEIKISGEIVQHRQLLPVSASVSLKGRFDLETGDLDIQEGTLNTLKNNHISLKGKVQGLNGKSPKADLLIGPVIFDLKEIYGHIAPSIPEIQTFPLDFHKNPSVLKVDHIRFSGSLISGPSKVAMTGLELSIPDLDMRSGDISLAVSNATLSVTQATSVLEDYFPTQADITVNLGIDQMDLRGPSSIHLNKLIIPEFDIDIKDIEKAQHALFGLSAQATVKQSMNLKAIDVPGLVKIGGFSQSLEAHCVFFKEKKADIQIKGLNAGAADFLVDNPTAGSPKTDLHLDFSAPLIRIHNLDPFLVDLKDTKSLITLGNLVRLKMTAGAIDLAASEINTRGHIKIGLRDLPGYLPVNLFDSLNLSGFCDIEWDIEGRLPNKNEVDRLEKIDGFNLKNDLKFIDHIETSIKLVDTDVDLQFSENKRINLVSFSASPLIHYQYDGGEGKGNVKGHIMVNQLKEIPGLSFDTPISGEITFSGIHDGLRNITLSQEAVSDSLKLKETTRVSISGINRILRENPHGPWPHWLNMAGASIQGGIRVSDCSVLNQFQNDVVLKGALGVDTSVTLVPGESISASMLTGFHHVFLDMEKYLSMEDLQGQLNFSKVYGIDSQQGQAKGLSAKQDLLSLRVMETGVPGPFPAQKDTYFRPGSEIETQYHPDHTILFSSAKSDAGPVPIELSMFRAEIGLNQGLPELKRFQVDLLGGTIIGAFAVMQRNDLYFIYTWINFTGIDLAGFFPKKGRKIKKQDTEISGQLNMFLPVSKHLSIFLENLHVDLFFSHIGVRALERFLYALDPYENNEVIVTQRRILKIGTPRYIRMEVKDGSYSLTGKIDVKGVTQPIFLEPINITSFSNFNKLEGVLDVLAPVIEILRIASSGTIQLGDTITFE